MFANNEKISLRQLGRLLTLDWVGKLCLLLPLFLSPLPGWNRMLALVLGGVWAFLLCGILRGLAPHIRHSFTGYLRRRMGLWVARVVAMAFFLYMLLNQIYLARAASRTCRLFLLPEVNEEVIGLLILLAGLGTAYGSIQKRGRAAECLFPLVAFVLIGMLAAAAVSVKAEYFPQLPGIEPEEILRGSGLVFAAFGGMGVLVYEIPRINCQSLPGKTGEDWTKNLGRVIKRSLGGTLLFLLGVFVVMMGSLGERGFQNLPWPALTLMSNVNIPGGFLQRWDMLFLGVLVLSLFTASGTGIYYMSRILAELFPGKKRKNMAVYAAVISGVVLLISGSYETAEALFDTWACRCMIPVMTAFLALLWVLERVKEHGEKEG